MRANEFWQRADESRQRSVEQDHHFQLPFASINALCDIGQPDQSHMVMIAALVARKTEYSTLRARILSAPLDDQEGRPLVHIASRVYKHRGTGLYRCGEVRIATARNPAQEIERLDLRLSIDHPDLPSVLGSYSMNGEVYLYPE